MAIKRLFVLLTLGWPEHRNSVKDLPIEWIGCSLGLLGDVMVDQLSTRGLNLLNSVALRGIRVPSSILESLNHLCAF